MNRLEIKNKYFETNVKEGCSVALLWGLRATRLLLRKDRFKTEYTSLDKTYSSFTL